MFMFTSSWLAFTANNQPTNPNATSLLD